MIRFGLLIVLGLATLGCSSTRRVVVRQGYPGATPRASTTPQWSGGRPMDVEPVPPGPGAGSGFAETPAVSPQP